MDNSTRLAKLQLAEKLIREVEFSYKQDSDTRRSFYRAVVESFGMASFLGNFMQDLKNTYHKIPKYADHFPIAEVIEMVENYTITEDDGHGYYATETEETNIPLNLFDIKHGKVNPQFTHATWYNK